MTIAFDSNQLRNNVQSHKVAVNCKRIQLSAPRIGMCFRWLKMQGHKHNLRLVVIFTEIPRNTETVVINLYAYAHPPVSLFSLLFTLYPFECHLYLPLNAFKTKEIRQTDAVVV